MKKFAAILMVLGLVAGIPAMAKEKAPGKDDVKCEIEFTYKAWAAVYQSGHGDGSVKCSNGQTAKVVLKEKGGGLAAGKWQIDEGKGTFTNISDISEIYGTYAKAEASASAVAGGQAVALTKGDVSFVFTGKGDGWGASVSLGGFTVKKAKEKKSKS